MTVADESSSETSLGIKATADGVAEVPEEKPVPAHVKAEVSQKKVCNMFTLSVIWKALGSMFERPSGPKYRTV